MRWIRTGRQIGQAVKNVQRLRQISSVLARHGFTDILVRMNLGRFLPERLASYAESQSEVSTAERLTKSFEQLGPAFVKLGQLLSTRPDLLPESYIEQFTTLQDDVQPLPFDAVRKVVETELGKSLEESFASFDPKPLASASVAQAHLATLRTGEKVVVKVQRPEIARIIQTDISLLQFLAGLLEKYVPESRIVGPRVIVEEFFRTLTYELDFTVELNNMVKIAENLKAMTDIVIPRAFREFSTRRVLTLERLEGVRLNDLKALEAAGIDRKRLVELGARAFFKTVLIDGLFHGDLHGGNMFALPGSRLGVIDFGIVGRLSPRSRDQLANMVMSLMTEDYENLCYQYAELGAASGSIDFDAFQRAVQNSLSPYLGLTLKEVNVGRVLIDATRIATKFNIRVPGDWMLVFKAMLTTEGMGRKLDPSFDMMAMGRELVSGLVKNQYSTDRLSRDLLWIAKDSAALLQVLPRQLRWMLKKFAANDYALELKLPQLDELRDQLDANAKRSSLSVLAAGLFIAAALAREPANGHHLWGYPPASVVFALLGGLLVVRLLLKRS